MCVSQGGCLETHANTQAGTLVAQGTGPASTSVRAGGGTATVNVTLSLGTAELWSVARPYLYTVSATVSKAVHFQILLPVRYVTCVISRSHFTYIGLVCILPGEVSGNGRG